MRLAGDWMYHPCYPRANFSSCTMVFQDVRNFSLLSVVLILLNSQPTKLLDCTLLIIFCRDRHHVYLDTKSARRCCCKCSGTLSYDFCCKLCNVSLLLSEKCCSQCFRLYLVTISSKGWIWTCHRWQGYFRPVLSVWLHLQTIQQTRR